MKELIRAILLEYKEQDLPQPMFRKIEPPKLPSQVRKAWVLMGMRRSGKTWTAYQHILHRQKLGFPKTSNLYLNFEDDRLADFKSHHFQTILDVDVGRHRPAIPSLLIGSWSLCMALIT